MASIFTKIINGDIPSFKVAESGEFLAFLDIMPLEKGHVLIVPKKEVDYIFDLDVNTYEGLWNFSKQVSLALKKAIECKRIGIAVVGLEVPHAHVHLIPLQTGAINFSNPKLKFSNEELRSIAERIAKEFKLLS